MSCTTARLKCCEFTDDCGVTKDCCSCWYLGHCVEGKCNYTCYAKKWIDVGVYICSQS